LGDYHRIWVIDTDFGQSTQISWVIYTTYRGALPILAKKNRSLGDSLPILAEMAGLAAFV
jgi:hypothetical protein